MLKKNNRIKQKKDFDRIFREGKKLNTDFLLLKVTKNNSDWSRFGFVISKKVSKSSAVRNKIKRILSEIVRKKILDIKDGLDIIFIVKSDFTKKGICNTDELVENSLKSAFCLKKHG